MDAKPCDAKPPADTIGRGGGYPKGLENGSADFYFVFLAQAMH